MFKEEVTGVLKKNGILDISLTIPPNPEMGDLSLACFKIGGAEKAKELSQKIKSSGNISKIVAVGPYLNFFADWEKLGKETVKSALKKDYGKQNNKTRILIEHTSNNPNAPPHVGRSRNAILADSLVRVFRFLGHKVEVHYFVNDIGKQIAMLVYAIRELKGKPSFNEMLRHYIEINRKILENVQLEKEITGLLYKLENGDKKTKKLFQDVVSTCINGQVSIFNEMGIKYDSFDYESKYIGSSLLKETFRKLKHYTKKDEVGRLVLDLKKFNLPMKAPFVPITREDGTSLYFLRDIVYNVEKAKWAKKGKNLVVLGEDHKLEYQQVKSALELMKIPAPEVIHYSFILLPDGKMSTRAGNIVLLTDFMNETVEKAKHEILKRNLGISPEKLEKISKTIGYAAIKYSILKVSAEKNVIFSWEEALNFEGNSAPYIQYTYVRARKILDIAGKFKKEFRFSEPEEINLIKKIEIFPEIVESASKNYELHTLAKYVFELASLFNSFYEKCRVIQEEIPEKRNSRLALVQAYSVLVKNCAHLLGMEVPDLM